MQQAQVLVLERELEEERVLGGEPELIARGAEEQAEQ